MKKRTKYLVALFSLLVFIVFCVAMEMNSSAASPRVKIDTKQASGYGFVDIQGLKKYVSDQAKGVSKDSLPTKLLKLESKITKDRYIEKVRVYLLPSGAIKVDLWEKTPSFRLINGGNSFVSTSWDLIPIKAGVSVDVMLVEGDIDSSAYKVVGEFLEILKNDTFFNPQAVGVNVEMVKSSGNKIPYFTIQIKAQDMKVVIGTMDDIDKKIENFKTIYAHLYTNDKIDVYKVVNLEFVNYLICQKK